MTDGPLFSACVYCGTEGVADDDGMELHAGLCPFVTNVFPVDETQKKLACPCCDSSFADEEFYTTVIVDPSHPAALEVAEFARDTYQQEGISVAFAVCLSCAVTGREIPST